MHFPKKLCGLYTFPQLYTFIYFLKKKTVDSSTQHDLDSTEKYGFVTGYKQKIQTVTIICPC